jgi:hypothetical protein
MICAKHAPNAGHDSGLTMRLLRSAWRISLEGYALNGSCMHGHPLVADPRDDSDEAKRRREQ